MHAIKTLKLGLFVAIPLAVFAMTVSPAQAYFRQVGSYPQQYNRHENRDYVSQLTQSNLNFVGNFVFIPARTHSYFYPSNNYGGGGYGY